MIYDDRQEPVFPSELDLDDLEVTPEPEAENAASYAYIELAVVSLTVLAVAATVFHFYGTDGLIILGAAVLGVAAVIITFSFLPIGLIILGIAGLIIIGPIGWAILIFILLSNR